MNAFCTISTDPSSVFYNTLCRFPFIQEPHGALEGAGAIAPGVRSTGSNHHSNNARHAVTSNCVKGAVANIFQAM